MAFGSHCLPGRGGCGWVVELFLGLGRCWGVLVWRWDGIFVRLDEVPAIGFVFGRRCWEGSLSRGGCSVMQCRFQSFLLFSAERTQHEFACCVCAALSACFS